MIITSAGTLHHGGGLTPHAEQAIPLRRQIMEEAAKIAREGCLLQPDGGSPTEAEVQLCDEIARRILAAI